MLTEKELLAILEKTGLLKEGHFLLTSGLHSSQYMQCAQLLQYPEYAEVVCQALAEPFQGRGIEVVVGPALGGVIVAYETSRALKAKNIHAERENGKMTFRRGFALVPGQKVLIVEDVVTTGGSVKEVMNLVRQAGAELVGVAAIVDRSQGRADFGVPFHALLKRDIPTYSPEDCPLCRQGIPVVKPGSRNIASSA